MAAKKVWIKVICIIACVLLFLVFLTAVAWGILTTQGLGITVGRCLATDGGEFMLIDGESPIVLHDRGRGDLFEKLSTGDKILVVHAGVQESYPAGTGAFFCLRLQKGSAEDIPAEVRRSLAELGWYKGEVPERIAAQYIRTNGGAEGETYPQSAVIRSPQELNDYVSKKKATFNMANKPFEYAISKYTEDYFKSHSLVMILLQESSGSNRHNVRSAEVQDGVLTVTVERILPEMGTCDMAQWHILLETAAEFESVKVELVESRAEASSEKYEIVCAEHDGMSLVFSLPASWEYRHQKYDEQSGIFGVRIFPKDHPQESVSIAYHTKGFGVCGTGLDGRRYVLAERAVYEGTYDGKAMWDYISFDDTKNQLIVLNEGCGIDRKDELMQILNTILIGE